MTNPFAVGSPAPAPLLPGTEQEIISQWTYSGPPLVSVFCTTYNHAPFLRDALNGMLGQVTTFPFEVLVRDDASTDGTTDIVRDFASRYPRIIKPIIETENQYSKGVRAASRMLAASQGEFIAKCEGDDYWIDPSKLERQAAILKERSEIVLVHHDACIIQDGIVTKQSKLFKSFQRDISSEDLKKGPFLLTLSLMYRKSAYELPAEQVRILNGDTFLLSRLGFHGGAAFCGDLLPAVYRVHPGGVWSLRPADTRTQESVRSLLVIGHYYQKRGERELAEHYFGRAAKTSLSAASDRSDSVKFRFAVALLIEQVKKFGRRIKRKIFR